MQRQRRFGNDCERRVCEDSDAISRSREHGKKEVVGQGAELSLDAPEEFEVLQGPPREHAQEGVERAGIARLAPCWLRPCHPDKA